MSGKLFNRFIVAMSVAFALPSVALADDGAPTGYTPYSIYGLGDLAMPGSAYNRTMAGSGVALRDHKFINILNPASVSARDSLSFMLDFSVNGTNKIFRQELNGENYKSAKNMASIGDIYLSFPIWNKLAMYAGVSQFSSVGYAYYSTESNPTTINQLGQTVQSNTGTGGLYQVSVGIGQEFFKRVAIGGEFEYIFGQISQIKNVKFSNTAAVGISDETYKNLYSFSGKFGLQYLQPIGSKFKFGIGATYRLASNLQGDGANYKLSTKTDTAAVSPDGIRIADEIVAGLSLHFNDKLTVSFDWSRSDWSGSGIDENKYFAIGEGSMPFKSTLAQAFRLGVEYVPNKTDVRYYWKRIAYRAGAYYKNDYFTVAGHNVNAWGVTAGITLPVFRWYNGLTLGFEFGKRGTQKYDMVSEQYFNFTVAVNMFDIWFQKPRYE